MTSLYAENGFEKTILQMVRDWRMPLWPVDAWIEGISSLLSEQFLGHSNIQLV